MTKMAMGVVSDYAEDCVDNIYGYFYGDNVSQNSIDKVEPIGVVEEKEQIEL